MTDIVIKEEPIEDGVKINLDGDQIEEKPPNLSSNSNVRKKRLNENFIEEISSIHEQILGDTNEKEISDDSEKEISSSDFDEINQVSYNFGRFIVFPPDSIKIIAEQCDSDITDELASELSEDVSYRVHNLIHSAAQYMKHSFRSKLTTRDVFKAMQELDCDLILGHNNPRKEHKKSINNYYSYVPEANVFVENDTIVDLRKESLTYLNNNDNHRKQNNGTKYHKFYIEWFTLTNPICGDFFSYTMRKTDPIDTYFFKLIETIFASKISNLNEQNICLKIFYQDISTNPSLKIILCPLFYFIKDALTLWEKLKPPSSSSSSSSSDSLIKFHKTQLRLYKIFLNLLHSIIQNPGFIDITLDSKIFEDFIIIILSVCFKEFSLQSITIETYAKLFHQLLDLRRFAAYLFSQLIYKFVIPFTNMQHKLIAALCLSINLRIQKIRRHQDQQPLVFSSIDFAMLTLFRYLGFDMCLRYLIPLLMDDNSFFNYYFKKQPETDWKKDSILEEISMTIRGEINSIGRLVLKGLNLLLLQKPDDFVMLTQSDRLYSYFYEHFGESFSSSNPLIMDMPAFHQNKNVWLVNWRSIFPKEKSDKKSPEEFTLLSQKNGSSKEKSSPNKTHKKKGTGLLESMLSTDTTKLGKSESLSMFSSSLLNSSHHHQIKYERIFLYEQDVPSSTMEQNYLIMFEEGHRIQPKKEDEEEETTLKKIRIHNTTIPFNESKLYNLSLKSPSMVYLLPSLRFGGNIPTKNKNTNSNFNPLRHQLFHYHRLHQHHRTNLNLYTCL